MLALRPSTMACGWALLSGSLCVLALASSGLDLRVGAWLFIFIYGVTARELARCLHRHPRAVVALQRQAAALWSITYQTGVSVSLRWLPSSVVTRHCMVLHGEDASQRSHRLVLFSDMLPPAAWRRLTVAIRLGWRGD